MKHRVLLKQLAVSQLAKKFTAFFGTRGFITAFTTARYPPLSCASSIQLLSPHPTS